ncbi:hypothetical protein [Candidatus Enterovibrio escicola]|uniref:Mobile element protein n=1 Tax=Candidatus Enterovibrio escicola TaxID=1927127 RepID=A0A2A5T2V9_9GAMM|nr:hypothetical protein [Candidatus Enterovibrio escacola]PCS22486.1 Mobile element protein [Candidatus Enterovibrio escacola]
MNTSDAVFTKIDDLYQNILPAQEGYLISDIRTRNKPSRFSISKVIMIIISFNQSWFGGFKTY